MIDEYYIGRPVNKLTVYFQNLSLKTLLQITSSDAKLS